MARVAVIMPYGDMLKGIYKMARDYQLDLMDVAFLDTQFVGDSLEKNLIDKIQSSIALNPEIIISRGGYAQIVQSLTDIPVVEIRLTMHEIGLLIIKAKSAADKPSPAVSLLGSVNLFCDLNDDEISEQYGVKFRHYMVNVAVNDNTEETIDQIIQDGADVLISGLATREYVTTKGIPWVRTISGKESLANACNIASKISYAIDMRKKNSANFKAILDYTYSGILQINEGGQIQHISQFVEQLLNITEAQAQGSLIWELIPSLSQKLIYPVLREGQEIYSTRIVLNRNEFLTSVVPVLLDDKVITGAIVCFHEGRQAEIFAYEKRTTLIQKGFVARAGFKDIITRSSAIRETISNAKRCARFECPILIIGESGTEFNEFAQSIHNDSNHSENAFITVACDGLSPDETERVLFSPPSQAGGDDSSGLAYKSGSTLYLKEVSALSPAAQFKLYQFLVRDRSAAFGAPETHSSNIRVIASDSLGLRVLSEHELFRRDLYFELSAAKLRIPPLRERREDIDGWVEYFISQYQKEYGRFVRLTREAMEFLHDFPWPGNLSELRNVCRRILAMSPRRTVDARFVAQLLDEETGSENSGMAVNSVQKIPDLQAARIEALLTKHRGSRTAVANELGVSTTMLWRQMKKYGIN